MGHWGNGMLKDSILWMEWWLYDQRADGWEGWDSACFWAQCLQSYRWPPMPMTPEQGGAVPPGPSWSSWFTCGSENRVPRRRCTCCSETRHWLRSSVLKTRRWVTWPRVIMWPVWDHVGTSHCDYRTCSPVRMTVCVCVYACVCVWVCLDICLCVCLFMFFCLGVWVCMCYQACQLDFMYFNVSFHYFVWICLPVCVFCVCVCVCVCVSLFLCLSLSVCVCVWYERTSTYTC